LSDAPLSFGRVVRTARLVLAPVGWRDMDDMAALKGDAGAFGLMLGGVRRRQEAEAEMAQDVAFWARHRVGIFTIRENGLFHGMTGLHERPDRRGMGLRFAIFPRSRGRGIAREAAAAALRFGHEQGVERIVAVARETNIASRTVLGGIGMTPCETFERDGYVMLVYESIRPRKPGARAF